MQLTLQVILNGILLGGLYACMAMGFSIVWGVMNLINLAYGSMIMLGAYVTWAMSIWLGVHPLLALPGASAVLFVLGYALQRGLINRLVEKSMFMTLILTFGLNMAMINVNILLFTADVRSIPSAFGNDALGFFGLSVPVGRAVVFALAIGMTFSLQALMNRTRIGNSIMATSFDAPAARLCGINVAHVYAVTFGIGAAVAGAVGALIAMTYSFSPVSGEIYTMKSFVVVVLGGLGSVPGAIVGGVLLGVAENLASLYFDPGYRDAVGFGLLIAILIVRRQGLMGRRFFAEVKM
jgi:branched-chain amino acid transport system permease protein